MSNYGTNLVNIGTPANTLKELMGHSSIVTTMKFYVNSIDENKKKAAEGLDRLMGWGGKTLVFQNISDTLQKERCNSFSWAKGYNIV